MDAMELTGKTFKCKSGSAMSGRKAHVHNFPAEVCIMVVLRRLSFPGTFHEMVDIFRPSVTPVRARLRACVKDVGRAYARLRADCRRWSGRARARACARPRLLGADRCFVRGVFE